MGQWGQEDSFQVWPDDQGGVFQSNVMVSKHQVKDGLALGSPVVGEGGMIQNADSWAPTQRLYLVGSYKT